MRTDGDVQIAAIATLRDQLWAEAVTMFNAGLLTLVANLIKKPPLWNMAIEQIRTMKEGVQADGSKAERELGISYTPIRVALEEAIESYR